MTERDDLAYGDDYGGNRGEESDYQGGERGFIGDTFNKLRDKYHQSQQPPYSQNQQPYGQGAQGYQSGQYGQSGLTVRYLESVLNVPMTYHEDIEPSLWLQFSAVPWRTAVSGEPESRPPA